MEFAKYNPLWKSSYRSLNRGVVGIHKAFGILNPSNALIDFKYLASGGVGYILSFLSDMLILMSYRYLEVWHRLFFHFVICGQEQSPHFCEAWVCTHPIPFPPLEIINVVIKDFLEYINQVFVDMFATMSHATKKYTTQYLEKQALGK